MEEQMLKDVNMSSSFNMYFKNLLNYFRYLCHEF